MAFVINTAGVEKEIFPKNGSDFKLNEMQAAIGGMIETVSLSTGKLLIVDEEGLLKGLRVNTKASIIARRTIVGPVIVCEDSQVK